MKKLKYLLVVASVAVASVSAATLPVQQAEAAGPCRYTNYRRGNRATCVRYIQIMLNVMQSRASQWAGGYTGGYYVAVDGVFGRHTYNNVKVFQRWVNTRWMTKMPVDGIVGPLTWQAFDSYAYRNGLGPKTYWQQVADSIDPAALGFYPEWY